MHLNAIRGLCVRVGAIEKAAPCWFGLAVRGGGAAGSEQDGPCILTVRYTRDATLHYPEHKLKKKNTFQNISREDNSSVKLMAHVNGIGLTFK